jgi:hypothetical protein
VSVVLQILLWWLFAGATIAPAFFIAFAKKLDAVQQNCVIYSRHRKMSFFSTPSFGGYLPEHYVPAFLLPFS